jgi:hypothetical protein
MEQEEKTQKTNEEKNSQSGCCDFTSKETQGMFKMMQDFCDGSEKDSFDCRSMMKEMMKNMSSKSDGCDSAGVKSNVQNKSNKPDTNVENSCC